MEDREQNGKRDRRPTDQWLNYYVMWKCVRPVDKCTSGSIMARQSTDRDIKSKRNDHQRQEAEIRRGVDDDGGENRKTRSRTDGRLPRRRRRKNSRVLCNSVGIHWDWSAVKRDDHRSWTVIINRELRQSNDIDRPEKILPEINKHCMAGGGEFVKDVENWPIRGITVWLMGQQFA